MGDALAARATEERYNASVRLIRPVEAARARASSQAGYFAPPVALMNASRSFTSFTSIATSDNGRDWGSNPASVPLETLAGVRQQRPAK